MTRATSCQGTEQLSQSAACTLATGVSSSTAVQVRDLRLKIAYIKYRRTLFRPQSLCVVKISNQKLNISSHLSTLDTKLKRKILFVIISVLCLHAAAISCRDAPKLGNATSDSSTAMYNDHVTYTCRDRHWFSRQVLVRQSRCLSDGTWELQDDSCTCELSPV